MKNLFVVHNRFIIAVGIVVATIFSACTKGDANSGKQVDVPSLPVVEIDTSYAETKRDYVGAIEGKVNVEIRPQVDGYLDEIYVDEGAYVKEGQLLFRINEQQYQEQLNIALANQNVAKAKLINAELEVKRLEPLVSNNVVSEIQLQSAKASLEVAKAQLAQTAAAVASAQISLDFTRIKAPVDGFIGRIPKRIGNLVRKNDAEPMTILSDIHEVFVYFSMSESDFLYFNQENPSDSLKSKLMNIPPAELILADGSLFEERGTVDAVDGQFNKNTGAISLRATFPNSSGVLRSGNTGKIRLTSKHQGTTLIPVISTVELQDKVFVYVLEPNNRVKRTAITLGEKSGHNYIVKSGLKNGDKIVVMGVENLEDGMLIIPQIGDIYYKKNSKLN